jgi:hypothetical protein
MDLDHLRTAAGRGEIDSSALGPVEHWPALLAALPSDPLLVPVAHAVSGWLDGHGSTGRAGDASPVCAALADAISSTDRPALFRDAADRVVESSVFLEQAGRRFAGRLIDQARYPGVSAESQAVLRAADALEIATSLCIGGWGTEWSLFTVLDTSPATAEPPYQRAVIRSVVACREQWVDATRLTGAVRRIGRIDPDPNATAPSDTDLPPGIESDAGVALARLAIIDALRAPDRDVAVEHLTAADGFLRVVLEFDDRVDATVVSHLIELLRTLIVDGTMDAGSVAQLVEIVREHQHFRSGTSHWAGDRTAASNAAWAQLAIDFRAAAEELAKPSWYSPGRVIDDIIDLYRTSRSHQLYVRAEDGEAVGTVIAPVLADGFAQRNALLTHLDDHVSYLQHCASDRDASDRKSADLATAIQLRDDAKARLEDLERKPGAGAAENLTGSSESPADRQQPTSHSTELRNAVTAQLLRTKSTGSLAGDTLLDTISAAFSASDAYSGDGRDAADLVAHLLVTFLFERSRLGPAERPYLFDSEAVEADLAKDLYSFLIAHGRLGDIRVEVRGVASGRVDLEFAFPGFNLYVELKVDSTSKPLSDKPRYLRQTATYQVESINLGFLLVLKLLKPGAVPPRLEDCLEVIGLDDDSGAKRFVAAMTVAGAKTVPSSM